MSDDSGPDDPDLITRQSILPQYRHVHFELSLLTIKASRKQKVANFEKECCFPSACNIFMRCEQPEHTPLFAPVRLPSFRRKEIIATRFSFAPYLLLFSQALTIISSQRNKGRQLPQEILCATSLPAGAAGLRNPPSTHSKIAILIVKSRLFLFLSPRNHLFGFSERVQPCVCCSRLLMQVSVDR
jgi:hypothetical protein